MTAAPLNNAGHLPSVERMTAALDFGCVWVNTHIPFVSEMSHGGFGASGHGKDLSACGLEEYTRVNHVMSNVEA